VNDHQDSKEKDLLALVRDLLKTEIIEEEIDLKVLVVQEQTDLQEKEES